ncbi:hypothetical protein [Deinococcus peraridilitoris]|uniref:Uncharacterized protein n=1 Tax=Deinococcus peraridilitoris (strain DSM 19664 / LMG 22246 / CIP 109416 / KR-200) TaxID=937777 RepID=K9ZYS8_DEIPD|nr:hypothetical protein [Deinococcus peraridilitoris]AFZ66072.1 hypothetical protein Deipe_0476 [Deinococcus peraridilitoris DSM 19664]
MKQNLKRFDYAHFSVATLKDGVQFNGEGATPEEAVARATERLDAHEAQQREAQQREAQRAAAAQEEVTDGNNPDEATE